MKVTYRIEGLECANCAARMEKVLQKMDGVKSASVNFMTSKVALEIEGDEEKIRMEAEAKIKKIEPQVKLTRL